MCVCWATVNVKFFIHFKNKSENLKKNNCCNVHGVICQRGNESGECAYSYMCVSMWSRWCVQANHLCNGIIAMWRGSCVLHSIRTLEEVMFASLTARTHTHSQLHTHTNFNWVHLNYSLKHTTRQILRIQLFIMSPHTHTLTHTLLMRNGFWQWRGGPSITFVLKVQGIIVPEEGDDSQSKGQGFTHRSGCSLLIKGWLMITN